MIHNVIPMFIEMRIIYFFSLQDTKNFESQANMAFHAYIYYYIVSVCYNELIIGPNVIRFEKH